MFYVPRIDSEAAAISKNMTLYPIGKIQLQGPIGYKLGSFLLKNGGICFCPEDFSIWFYCFARSLFQTNEGETKRLLGAKVYKNIVRIKNQVQENKMSANFCLLVSSIWS